VKRQRQQVPFRFSADPDPRYCARAFCRIPRRKRPTHIVLIDGREYRVCGDCARKWESVRSATVKAIHGEVFHA
jgi:hypothetical protein